MASNPIRLSNSYSAQLDRLGLHCAALRAEFSCYKKAYADSSGAEFTKIHNWNSMLRTMPFRADQVADNLLYKYSPLESLVDDSFAAIEIRCPQPNNPGDGSVKMFIYNTRKVLKRLLRNAIDNLGATNEYVSLRVINLAPIDHDLRAKLEAALPSCRWRNLPKHRFQSELERLTNPLLPDDDIRRANYEYFLHNLHQSIALGASCRRKCAIKRRNNKLAPNGDPPLTSNLDDDRPINPATGLRAVRFTCPLPPDMPLSMIPREWWGYYSDFRETDCTTKEQHAEMMAIS
jgi:hypothetical protein